MAKIGPEGYDYAFANVGTLDLLNFSGIGSNFGFTGAGD